jgi:hypothetical protein
MIFTLAHRNLTPAGDLEGEYENNTYSEDEAVISFLESR